MTWNRVAIQTLNSTGDHNGFGDGRAALHLSERLAEGPNNKYSQEKRTGPKAAQEVWIPA